MVTFTATFDLTMIYFVAVNLVAILAYVLMFKHRARRIQCNLSTISTAILEYFRENGGDVKVECISRPGGRRFIALISSGPMKRFRHSNVVEVILRDHVRKTCGLDLETVYWCFPIKRKADVSAREAATGDSPTIADTSDDYGMEGMEELAKLPGYHVTESSLEKFQETIGRKRYRAEKDHAFTFIVASS